MWKQLADFDGSINGLNMTVRVTKSDDSVKPKYSIAIGTRNDPQPFRPFLRGDMLAMHDEGKFGLDVLHKLLGEARVCMTQDKVEHDKKLAAAETERLAQINGKRQGDPKANTGLSRFKKKHRKDATDSG